MRLVLGVTLALSILVAAIEPTEAQILQQEWQEFAFPIADVSGCAGEDGVASGMVHYTVTSMPSGWVGVHINAEGIVEGNDSGALYLWRDNITDIVPVVEAGELFVGTYRNTLKIIGPGNGLAKFMFSAKVHLTEIDGVAVVYFDEASFSCKNPQS